MELPVKGHVCGAAVFVAHMAPTLTDGGTDPRRARPTDMITSVRSLSLGRSSVEPPQHCGRPLKTSEGNSPPALTAVDLANMIHNPHLWLWESKLARTGSPAPAAVAGLRSRAEEGGTTAILKVKARTGVEGNEQACRPPGRQAAEAIAGDRVGLYVTGPSHAFRQNSRGERGTAGGTTTWGTSPAQCRRCTAR